VAVGNGLRVASRDDFAELQATAAPSRSTPQSANARFEPGQRSRGRKKAFDPEVAAEMPSFKQKANAQGIRCPQGFEVERKPIFRDRVEDRANGLKMGLREEVELNAFVGRTRRAHKSRPRAAPPSSRRASAPAGSGAGMRATGVSPLRL
jgi:hypothetical protein